MTKIVKSFFRALLFAVVGAIGLFLLLFIAVHIPSIQEYLVNRVQQSIMDRSGYQVEIEKVDIKWFDVGVLKGVTLYDLNKHPMLTSEEIVVNFNVLGVYRKQSFNLEGVYLYNGKISLVKYEEDEPYNISSFLNALRRENTNQFGGQISEMLIQNIGFELVNRTSDSQMLIDSEIINLRLNDMRFEGGQWLADLQGLSVIERQLGLEVLSANAGLTISSTGIELKDFFIETSKGRIGEYLKLDFPSFSSLKYPFEEVNFKFKTANSHIHTSELHYFKIPYFDNDLIQLKGEISGSISELILKDFEATLNKDNHLYFNSKIRSILDPDSLEISAKITDMKINGSLLQDEFAEWKYGPIGFMGDLDFTGSDLFVDGQFLSAMGMVTTKVSADIASPLEDSRYELQASMSNFELGELLNLKDIGSVSGDLYAKGQGLSENKVKAFVRMDLSTLVFKQYVYNGVELSGEVSASGIDSKFEVFDKNMKVRGSIKYGLKNETHDVNTDLLIHYANFYRTNLSKDTISISGYAKVALQAQELNDIFGVVSFNEFDINNASRNLFIDEITLAIDTTDDSRIELLADGFKLKVSGDYPNSNLIQDVTNSLSFFADKFDVNKQNVSLSVPDNEYWMDLTIQAEDVGPYLDLLGKDYSFSSDSYLEFQYENGDTVALNFDFRSDTMFVGNRQFVDNSISSRLSGGARAIKGDFQMSSDQQLWDLIPSTSDFRLEAVWNDQDLSLEFGLKQPINESEVDLKSAIRLSEKDIALTILPSKFVAFAKPWEINEDNYVLITNEKIILEDVELYDKSQSVGVNGVISNRSYSLIDLHFRDFELINLSAILPKKFEGLMNSSGSFNRAANNKDWVFNTDVDIADLVFEDLLVGDIYGSIDWDKGATGLDVDMTISKDLMKTGSIKGFVNPLGEHDQLDIVVDLDRMNINWVEPLFASRISNVTGNAIGKIEVDGRIRNPSFFGTAFLNQSSFTLDYLNTDYTFNGMATFDRNEIRFDSMKVIDRYKNEASLKGFVSHEQFKGKQVDVQIDFENFELLNTNKDQNSIYYGNLYGTGDVRISGPFDDILIEANGTTAPNTNLHVPLEDVTNVIQQDYITFTNFNDTIDSDALESDIQPLTANKIRGVRLDMNVNVTRDAYIEMIFDPRTGDIIRGRGQGDLQMSVNNTGDFELFGQVEIQEGAYNWTTSIFNKEFKVVPGGVVSFYGDPYEGVINLEAYYRQLADPADWSSDFAQDGQLSQKSPLLVILDLDGPMTQPNINFRLELDENTATSSTLNSNWRDLLATVNGNEEELKRQVFSLLVLRKFSPRNQSSGQDQLGQGAANSVSEFMSNQLSYWLNQVDDNLEVSIDLTGLDQEAFETFQLRLAYTFMEGRLRVSGASAINSQQQETTVSNILGDWSVDYVLTEDGRLRIKIFSQTNQYRYSSDQNVEAGMSLQFVRSFDQFSELLGKSRKKGIEKQELSKELPETVSTN